MSNSIPDSQLGLTQSEIRLLRQHQQIALSQAGSNSTQAPSQSSQGRLLLDPTSLQALSAHFDRVMGAIQQRWAYLTQQTQTATQAQYDRAGNAMLSAQAQIDRLHAILREIDELQVEFDKVRRIGEIVRGFKARVEAVDRRLGR